MTASTLSTDSVTCSLVSIVMSEGVRQKVTRIFRLSIRMVRSLLNSAISAW